MELLRALLLLLSFAVINNLTAGYELSEIHESIDKDLSKYKNQGEVYAIHLNSWKDYTYEYHYNNKEPISHTALAFKAMLNHADMQQVKQHDLENIFPTNMYLRCGNSGKLLCSHVQFKNCVVVPPTPPSTTTMKQNELWILKILDRHSYNDMISKYLEDVAMNEYKDHMESDDGLLLSTCTLTFSNGNNIKSPTNTSNIETIYTYSYSPTSIILEDKDIVTDLIEKHILEDKKVYNNLKNNSNNNNKKKKNNQTRRKIDLNKNYTLERIQRKKKEMDDLVNKGLSTANSETIQKILSLYRGFVNSHEKYSKYLQDPVYEKYFHNKTSTDNTIQTGQQERKQRRSLLNKNSPAPLKVQSALGFPVGDDEEEEEDIQNHKKIKEKHEPIKLSTEDSHVIGLLQLEHKIRMAEKSGSGMSMKTIKEEVQRPVSNALIQGIPHILHKLLKFPIARSSAENMASEILPAVTDPAMDSLDSYWRQFAKDLPGLNMRKPEGGLDMNGVGIAEDLSMSISDEVIQQLTGRIVEILEPILVEGIPNVLTRELVRESIPQIAFGVTEALTAGITETIQGPVNRLATDDVTKGVIPAVTLALAPIITHSLSRKPRHDYYCFYCHHQAIYCSYCRRYDTESVHTDYYAGYYSSYFARYYTYYYGQMDPDGIDDPTPPGPAEELPSTTWTTMA